MSTGYTPAVRLSQGIPDPAMSVEVRFKLRVERSGDELSLIHEDTNTVLYAASSMDELLRWIEVDERRRRQPAKNLRAAIDAGVRP
jgi:hypothetical protein